MKLLLLAAVCAALLAAVSSTEVFPFPLQHPLWPPHGESAPPPSSHHGKIPSFPSPDEIGKCIKAAKDSSSMSCFAHNYNAGKCCTYLTGLGESCSYVPWFKDPKFKGIIKFVCDAGSN